MTELPSDIGTASRGFGVYVYGNPWEGPGAGGEAKDLIGTYVLSEGNTTE